jgi:hypothetical protein
VVGGGNGLEVGVVVVVVVVLILKFWENLNERVWRRSKNLLAQKIIIRARKKIIVFYRGCRHLVLLRTLHQ